MNAVKAALPRAMRQLPLLLTAAGRPTPSGCFVVLPAVTSVVRSTAVERTLHGAGALVSFFAVLLVSPVFKAVVVCLHMSVYLCVYVSRHACMHVSVSACLSVAGERVCRCIPSHAPHLPCNRCNPCKLVCSHLVAVDTNTPPSISISACCLPAASLPFRPPASPFLPYPSLSLTVLSPYPGVA